MDLLVTLKHKIDPLDDGEHMPGLRAVLLHIETAHRHLARGQVAGDETAYTDAIYRTNQAFEGSVKEAYRVLAGQDPARKRPYDIERYLEDHRLFRERVLRQLTSYRTEWRNPSTHDYKLDFDESEAFLAIVSVSAFACVLIDQIAERISFAKAQAEAEARKDEIRSSLAITQSSSLLDRAAGLLRQFVATTGHTLGVQRYEAQYVGALHGYLSSLAPEIQVSMDERFSPILRADLVLRHGDERVIVELKRHFKRNIQMSIAQVERYMFASGIRDAILVLIPAEPGSFTVDERSVPSIQGRLLVIEPQKH